MNFEQLNNKEEVHLYAGDMSEYLLNNNTGKQFVGLSLQNDDENHIKFDITKKFPIKNNTVDTFCAEDVMEHIYYESQLEIFNEIYRILKPEGVFRLAVPDYRCDFIYERTIKYRNGKLKFDPGGGGKYSRLRRKVINRGHVWFPKYESVKKIFDLSLFKKNKINYLHYYLSEDEFVMKDINYDICFISRTPDHDSRVAEPRRPLSIVVDAVK